MPHMDGWQTCREIRKESKVPIIMLTARSQKRETSCRGLNSVWMSTFPNRSARRSWLQELHAILRRTNALASDDLLHADGIEIDKAAHMVKIDGKTDRTQLQRV